MSVTGHVVVTDGERTLYNVGPDGKLVWSRKFKDRIVAARLSRDSLNTVVSFHDWSLAFLDVDGRLLWHKRFSYLISAFDIRISDGTILIGGSSRTISNLSRDGMFLDSMVFSAPIEFINISRDDDRVLVGNSGAFLASLNGAFETEWARSFAMISGVARFSATGKWIVMPLFGSGAYLIDSTGGDVRAFRPRHPVMCAAYLEGCSTLLLGTSYGELLMLDQDGALRGRFELSFRPRFWDIDHCCSFLAIVDEGSSLHSYQLVHGQSTRFSFLEQEQEREEPLEKKPIYSIDLFRRATSRHQAQVKLLPGGKYTLCATSDGGMLMLDESGRQKRLASLGDSIRICTASKSYRFAAATGGRLYSFGHDKMLWQRRAGTAMLALNAAGNRVAAMDDAGNIFLFDSLGELKWTWFKSRDARYFCLSPSGEEMVVAEASRAVVLDFAGRPVFETEFNGAAGHLAIDDDSLYIGDSSGIVSAYDLYGSQLWSGCIEEPVARLRPFEDGLLVTTGMGSAFFLDDAGKVVWRRRVAGRRSLVIRNQKREFIEVIRRRNALFCLVLGGELLWKVVLKDAVRSFAADASGEFVCAFDGVAVWLFSIANRAPEEPGRFDFLEL